MLSKPWCDLHRIALKPFMTDGAVTWLCPTCDPTPIGIAMVTTSRGAMKPRRSKGRCRPCDKAQELARLAQVAREAQHESDRSREYDSGPR